MRIRNLNVNLSKDDILGLCSYQDEIKINNLSIDKIIKINATYKVIGVNIDFEANIEYDKLENNIIYFNVNDFTIAKKNNINPLVKKSINFILNALSGVEGLYIDLKTIKIDLTQIINSYLVQEKYLVLNDLILSPLSFENNSIQFIIYSLDFNILKKQNK